MTEHDLSTLVRDHAAADEPPFPMPDAVLARGRRSVRARRGGAGALGAAVLAVAAALVVPTVAGDDPSRSPTPTEIDPAVQQALDDYDPQAMPQVLENAARTMFAGSMPRLGPARFTARGPEGGRLRPSRYGEANAMDVAFGGRTHEVRVSLVHARSEAEGDPEEACTSGLRDGLYVECTVDALASGDTLVTTVTALRPFPGAGAQWFTVSLGELSRRDPDRLWFQRQVEVIKSDTLLARAEETVKAASLEEAGHAFEVPVTDLAALAADPRLVIPRPTD